MELPLLLILKVGPSKTPDLIQTSHAYIEDLYPQLTLRMDWYFHMHRVVQVLLVLRL